LTGNGRNGVPERVATVPQAFVPEPAPVSGVTRPAVRLPVETPRLRGTRRRGPAQEMTAKDNAEINATLTTRGWGSLTVAELRAERARSLEDVPALYSGLYVVGRATPTGLSERMVEHLRRFVGIARRTSPSIGGDFRKDYVEAVRAAHPAVIGGGGFQATQGAHQEAPRDPLRGPGSGGGE
jgi:hypothetical protein